MKFILTFKTPDVLDQIEMENYSQLEMNAMKPVINKFIEFGEYISVQFDTEEMTATVLEN